MSIQEGAENPRLPSGAERDLENARVLIEDDPWSENPQKYRKTAELILRRILKSDPENQAARALLAKAETPLVDAAPAVLPVVETESAPSLAAAPPIAFENPAPEDSSFTIPTIQIKPEKKKKKRPIADLIGVAIAIAVSGLLMFGLPSNTLKGRYAPKLAGAAQARAEVAKSTKPQAVTQSWFSDPPARPEPPASTPAAALEPAKTNGSVLSAPVLSAEAAPIAPIPPNVQVTTKAPRLALVETGTLAVSSPTSVDIYIGQQLVGSAPATLELPAGYQTLEYRHLGMKKVMTHVITAKETTTAMVTFDIPVQINAKPWAQVFIGGSQRQPLGQTPLSDVRVPIGSTLIFENPNFQGKSYRVKGTETEIRVTFP